MHNPSNGAKHDSVPVGARRTEGGIRARPARFRSGCCTEVNGDACVTWLGPGSAGHFVKMVHNGIEYGVMQLLAETSEWDGEPES